MCVLIPQATSQEVEPNSLDYFAEKYGLHGALVDPDLETNQLFLLEVKRLEFDKTLFSFESQYSKVCLIPESERRSYAEAILYNPRLLYAYNEGKAYNVPIGLKRWISPDEPEYEKLKQLKQWHRLG